MGLESDAQGGPRHPARRTDAAHNRARILAAAQEIFAEKGLQASLDSIARRAEVGNATLYRHFPGREALLACLIEELAQAALEAAREAAAGEGDPFVAFSRFVHTLASRRIAAVCRLPHSGPDEMPGPSSRALERVEEAARRLLERAQAAGQARSDLCVEEVLAAVARLSRPLPGVGWQATDLFRARLVQLYLDGVTTPSAGTGHDVLTAVTR
ncbi:TetR/AcrR family transcriptional regulator [Streptomyces sp. NPDC048521]|uniref:TetR/AcrR family transcriptional regulator n=1 Tax=Streptomyces sp. NPDC048521 TaxID=3365566 RepID=UPI0037238A0A